MENNHPIELNHKIVATNNKDSFFCDPAYKETIDCKGLNLEQIKANANRYEDAKLTNVKINDCDALNLFNDLLKGFENKIIGLNFEGFHFLTNDQLNEILISCPNLEEVNLLGVTN